MYYRLSAHATATQVDTNIEKGLSSTEAKNRVFSSGSNTLPKDKRKLFLSSCISQAKNPMIYLLFAAAALSLLLGKWTDSLVILLLIIINTVLGAAQQRKASKTLEALQKLTVTHCTVRRDGEKIEIPADELAIGDIVILSPGCLVPADLRLCSSHKLVINEEALTGEPSRCEKDHSFLPAGDTPIADRLNMAYQGTVVTSGNGEGIVIATSMSTQVGQIAEMLNEQNTSDTPLGQKITNLGKSLGLIACGACIIIMFVGLAQNRDFWDLVLTSLSLVVATIPEGLMAVISMILALGVSKLVKRHAIVKNLPALEALGSVNVICTDKTGTLTRNKMEVTHIFCNNTFYRADEFSSKTCLPLLHGAALCNNVLEESSLNDPNELALINLCKQCGIDVTALNDEFPRISEISFDSRRKRMTTLHRTQNTTISYTKGAADIILPRCSHIWENGSIRKITESDTALIRSQIADMSGSAVRVFAIAMRCGDFIPQDDGMLFIGLLGITDPPRTEISDAFSICKKAGIRIIMITGDHKATATSVGRQLGVVTEDEQVITGSELDEMSDEQAKILLNCVCVVARVSPHHKVRIVRLLREAGNVVCTTGDGVNDAPSLKASDIGIAMGITGTDAAKASADIVLTDDNFSTVTKAIETGRNVLANIRKSIFFLLTSNIGELLSVFLAVLLHWFTPLLPLQILWVNLIISSLPALALGLDTPDPEIMSVPPRKKSRFIFTKNDCLNILISGVSVAITVLLAFYFYFAEIDGSTLEQARTFSLITLVLGQMFVSLSVRSGNSSVFKTKLFNNPLFIISLVSGVLLLIITVCIPPVGSLFDTVALPFTDWCAALVFALIPFVINEARFLFKFLKSRYIKK